MNRSIVPFAALRRLLLGGAVAGSLLLGTPAADATIIDRVLVQVNDEVVLQSDIVRFFPVYREVYGVPPTALMEAESCAAVLEGFVDFMVESRILLADAEARELGVTQSEVDAYISRGQAGRSEEDFARELGSIGIDLADFREFIELNLTRMRMIQLDVQPRIAVSDSDIEREIEAQYPDGLEERFIETHHIFVQLQSEDPRAVAAAEAAINERAERLAAGESFESIAASNDDGTARRGGRLGRISVLSLDPAYSEAALALEVGEVSEPVRSSFGFHIIRLDGVERVPVDDASDIRNRVAFDLQQERSEQEQALYLERVRNEAFVEELVEDVGWFCGLDE